MSVFDVNEAMMSKNLFLLSRKNFRYLIHKTVTKNEVIRDLSPRIAEKVSVLKLLKNEWMKNFKKILTTRQSLLSGKTLQRWNWLFTERLQKNVIHQQRRIYQTYVIPTHNRSCFTERGGVNHQYKIFWFQCYCSITLSRMSLQN